jgi:hypothetical protein
MATRTAYAPKLVEASPAKPMSTREVLVEGTQTYKAGYFLKIVAGLAKICTTSATGSGNSANAIQLYALTTLGTAIGADTTVKRFGIIHEDDIYEMNEYSTTMPRTKMGLQYGINVASGLPTVNQSNAYAQVQVIEPTWAERPYQDDSADTLARVNVKVLKTSIYVVAT